MEGMVTTMDCGGAWVEVRGVESAGIIMGVKVGGPWRLAMEVMISFWRLGGLGLLELSRSAVVRGEPGILGIILGALTDLGPGGRPGPMLVPRGDIFCLDLGLGWLGRLPAGPVYPILGPD